MNAENTNRNRQSCPRTARAPSGLVAAVSLCAAVLCGSSGQAVADLSYGTGSRAPSRYVAMSGYSAPTIIATNTSDFEETSRYQLDVNGWQDPYPYYYHVDVGAFQQSTLHHDTMRFYSRRWGSYNNYDIWTGWSSGPLFNGLSVLDVWVHVDDNTPFWLRSGMFQWSDPTARSIPSIKREDGTEVLNLSTDWQSVSGVLSGGWYHVVLPMNRAPSSWSGGGVMDEFVSGQIGIPAPGSLTLLMLGGLLATRRAR